jgi:hypothetical protein
MQLLLFNPAQGLNIPCNKLQGILDRKDFSSDFFIRSQSQQQAAGIALAVAVQPCRSRLRDSRCIPFENSRCHGNLRKRGASKRSLRADPQEGACERRENGYIVACGLKRKNA